MLPAFLTAVLIQGINFPEYGTVEEVMAAQALNHASETREVREPLYPQPKGYVRYRTRSGALIIERIR